jgi:pSer/pThr/pTyr-binding forkhead associated (FHA) protein
MTDQKQPPDSKEPQNTPYDLRKHAEQAIRMLRENENKTSAKPSTTDITNPMLDNTTTNDLRKAAQEALEHMQTQQRVSQPRGSTVFSAEMVLRIDVTDSSVPLVVEVQSDMVIGRSDNVSDYVPEIDLTRHGAYRLGLSRRHAIIRRAGNALELVDLGSRNGTMLNGDRLKPNETRGLADNDEITLGNLTMRLAYQNR